MQRGERHADDSGQYSHQGCLRVISFVRYESNSARIGGDQLNVRQCRMEISYTKLKLKWRVVMARSQDRIAKSKTSQAFDKQSLGVIHVARRGLLHEKCVDKRANEGLSRRVLLAHHDRCPFVAEH